MQVRRVTTIEDALVALAEFGDQARILAGGTDLMVQLPRGEVDATTLIPIERLSDLGTISANGTIQVGSLVTHDTLARGGLPAGFDSIREAAGTIGGWQTRSVGTIGGNICNASPAADTLPPLLVHDARVGLSSITGDRTQPLASFLTARRETTRRPDEMLTHIEFEPPPPVSGDVYLKVGRRSAMEVAIVGLAMCLTFDVEGMVAGARVAVASVAAVPFRSAATEAALVGSRPDSDSMATAAAALLEEMAPIDDLRSTARYRQLLIPGLIDRAVALCAQRAGVTNVERGRA